MKGTTHAAIGASAPAGLILTGHVSPVQGVAMALIAAGWSLAPDLDSPRSIASQALGAHAYRAIHAASRAATDATSTPKDVRSWDWMRAKKRDPYHRTLTHTLAATALVTMAAWSGAVLGYAFIVGMGALGVALLRPVMRFPFKASNRVKNALPLMVALASGVLAAQVLTPWSFALAVGVGYLSHLLADACTKGGVPLAWPLMIGEKRWWSVRFLGVRIASGSSAENSPAIGVSFASNGLLLLLGA